MTRHERRYLSRRSCWLCDQRLDRDSCGSLVEKCSIEVRNRRREACLARYKPRSRRESHESHG